MPPLRNHLNARDNLADPGSLGAQCHLRRRTLDASVVGIEPATPTRSSTSAITAVFVLRGSRSDFAKRTRVFATSWIGKEALASARAYHPAPRHDGPTSARSPSAIRVGAGLGHTHDVDRHHGLAKESSLTASPERPAVPSSDCFPSFSRHPQLHALIDKLYLASGFLGVGVGVIGEGGMFV
jgi:hypothetical protein